MDKKVDLNDNYFLRIQLTLSSNMSTGTSEYQIRTSMYDKRTFTSYKDTIEELRCGGFFVISNKPLNFFKKLTSKTSCLDDYLLYRINKIIAYCKKVADQCKSNSDTLKKVEEHLSNLS